MKDGCQGTYYDTIITSPVIRKSLLTKNALVGWGNTKVVIIDSGISDDSIKPIEAIDFTGTGLCDRTGHGTYIAKIIHHFAKGSNLCIAKVGDSGPEKAYVIRALKWACDIGANLVNLSCGFTEDRPLGGCKDKCPICKAVNLAASKGVTVIVAAGNDGEKKGVISCPGMATRAITVGAVDENGYLASYSSRGVPGVFKPNILAPGTISINGKTIMGTSFAAPIITGVLAATMNKYSDIENTIKIMYSTARDLGLPKHCQGHGVFEFCRFMEGILNENLNDRSTRCE